MYIEARPLSTYQPTPGWSIPPLSPGKLKQPPTRSAAPPSSSPNPRSRTPPQRPQLLGSGSSSSSLSGLEQTVPSFQSFVKRTPSKDSNKPLPPTPSLAAKRSEGSLIDSYFRRSSSIYSRSPSEWDTESISGWQIEQEPEVGPPLLLQPVAYSVSTPDLSYKNDAPPLLEPRVFSPLLISPSPTVSTFTVDRVESVHEPEPMPNVASKARQPRSPHQSLMPPNRPKAETISLEKAKQALKAPGAVPLLPEELRAQALKKTRSQGHIREVRLDSIDIFAAGGKGPQPPPLATLIDPQGRKRALLTPPIETATPAEEYPFLNIEAIAAKSAVPYAKAFHVGDGPVRSMAPPVAHARTVSREHVGLFPQDNDSDVSRGRQKQRRLSHNAGQADTVAQAYHSLLTQQQTRQASQSSGWSSDDSVRMRMKMIPQPLFQSKQIPGSRQPGGLSSSQSLFSVPGSHRRGGSDSSASSKRSTGFHLRLSPPTSTRTSSITGMIPISPPDDHNPRRSRPAPIDTDAGKQQKTQTLKLPKSKSHLSRNKSHDAFYPRFLRMKSSKKEAQKRAEDLKQAMQPGKPLLAADIVALKLKTPDSTPNTSPLANSPSLARTTSIGSTSDKGRRPIWERVAKNVAKGRRRSSNQAHDSTQKMSPGAFAPSPDSPHLFPSPVQNTTLPMLGWTDSTKSRFDKAVTPTHSPIRSNFTHVIGPPKPLDDSGDELAGLQSSRRPTLIGNVLDSWRENKAQKRREDLKRMIKVVGPEEVAPDQKVDEEEKEGWTRPVLGLQRKLSEFGWV